MLKNGKFLQSGYYSGFWLEKTTDAPSRSIVELLDERFRDKIYQRKLPNKQLRGQQLCFSYSSCETKLR